MKNILLTNKKNKNGLLLLFVVFCGLFANSVSAQNMFWGNTTGNNSWSTAANWTTTTRAVHTADFSSGATTITIATANLAGFNVVNLAVGQAVVGPGIAANTTIVSFVDSSNNPLNNVTAAGHVITLSTATIAAGTASVICIYTKSSAIPTGSNQVVIDNGFVGNPVISTAAVALNVVLRNSVGPETGTTLTINSGASLTISSTAVNSVNLAGASIINNGTLNITSTAAGASSGIICVNPTVLPLVAREYGYSGTGTLRINVSASTASNNAAVSVTSTNALTTYKMFMNSSTTTFTLANTVGSWAFRCASGAISPLIIDGTGVKLGTTASRVIGGLLLLGGQNTVTVNTGVTLEMNSLSTNTTNGIALTNNSAVAPTSFTNKGTINILGETARNGINVNIAAANGTDDVRINVINDGTINVDINAISAGNATPTGFSAYNATTSTNSNAVSSVYFTNNATGTVTLRNTAAGSLLGYAIWGSSLGQRTYTNFTNNGTLNIDGTIANVGHGFTLNNNLTVNSNSTFASFPAISNDAAGTINFTNVTVTNGIPSPTTNSGTINTNAISLPASVSGVTEASTGIIAPGGSGYGIADFAKPSVLAINSTFKLQIAGTTAGVNFDQITNTDAAGGFILTNAILDVTGIYTPGVSPTIIDILTTAGTLSGSFSTVTGLTTGWTVDYDTAGKVQLKYATPTGIVATATGGNWSATTTWVGGIVPTEATTSVLIPVGSTVIADISVTRDSGTTTTVDSGGTLATSETYINNGTTTINGSFRLDAGGVVSNAGGTNALVYGTGGTLIFNTPYTVSTSNYWPTTSGPTNVTVSASSALTLGLARTVTGIFQTASGITNANNLTFNGTLQLNAGGSILVAPNYGPSSTLIYNAAAYSRGAEWSATSGAGYPINVQIGNGVNTTLNVVNGAATTYRRAGGNLVVSTGSTLLITDLTTGVGTVGLEFVGNINNNGTITLDGLTNGRLKGVNLNNGVAITNGTSGAIVNLCPTPGGDLELTGNYNDNATFNANQRAVFFTGGSNTQTIGGNAPGIFNIDYIVVTKSASGGAVSLLKNTTTGAPNGGNGITLSTAANDILQLNGNTFTLGTANTACTVSGTGLIRSTIGSLIINGTGALGTLTFDGTNNTLVNLTINRTAGTGTPGVTLGTALNVTTTLALTSTTTLTLGGNLAISAAGNNSVAGIIEGTGALIKTGAGTLTLAGANTYSNGTSINVGSVSIGADNNIGSGNITLGGGTVTVTAGFTTSKTISLTAATSSTINVAASQTLVAGGIISGSGALVKTGLGILNLTAASGNNTANTYSGGTTISAASSGSINVTGLTSITSTAIAQTTQSVTFSTTTPPNGTYQLLPGALTVGTQSFSHNADATKLVAFNYANSTATVSSPTATITGATTAAVFTTIYGTASAVQVFPVSGANLTANLVATAPTGFQVSSDGTTYGSTATFVQSSGTASGSLSIRLAATATVAGTYNSVNIVLSSTGASNANIVTAASGNSVTAKALTITANNGVVNKGSTFATGSSTLFSSVGLANSDAITSITISSTGAASTSNFGTYPIVPAAAVGITTSNYTITYTNGTLTVNGIAGDYSSVSNGNWSTLATWRRHDGTNWVTPAPDYPGQSLPCRVFISDNNTVTADVTISGANRPTRLELLPNANNAVLNINAGVTIGIFGSAVIASLGPGTGDAILNVGSGTLAVTNILSLNDTPGSSNVCELRIGVGAVTVDTQLRMLGAANENAIIFDGAGTLTSTGTGASAMGTLGSLVAGNGTVVFNGAAQTVGPFAFNNLTLSGSGTKTINATSIGGNLIIAGTAIASLSAGYTVASLVYSGAGKIAGTYGSTSSAPAAAVQDNAIFAGTGRITVLSNIPLVTPTIVAFQYTGAPTGPTTATSSGIPAPLATNYSYSYVGVGSTSYGPSATPPTALGTYTVTVTVAAVSPWLSGSSGAVGFSITRRDITITAINDTKLVGLTHVVGSSSTAFNTANLQNGETIGTITIASDGAAAGAAVGSYPITPSLAVGGTFNPANYNITYTAGTLTVAGAADGDYRSKASGNWSALTTWERWVGPPTNAWIEPTVGQGYPSQNAAPGIVYIIDGHDVVCNVGISTANKPSVLELSAGSSNSSFSIAGSNTVEVGQLIVRASTAAGVSRSVNIGSGYANFSNTRIDDTGNDAIDSEITINTGGTLYSFGNIVMIGSSARNAIRVSGSGNLQLGANFTGGTLIPATGLVNFFRAGAQTIGAYPFYNLTLSGSGTKTLNSATTISENLTISGTAVASLPAQPSNTTQGVNYTINSLTLGTIGMASGTHGSTSSFPAATNTSGSFAATLGYVTVGKSTPDITITIGTYTYTGVSQGPNSASNTGTGTTYSYIYRGVAPTVYAASGTAPSIVGTYSVTANVAPSTDGLWAARTSTATAFTIDKAALTITANNATKIIGSTHTTGAGSTAFTSSGLQGTDTIGSITIASTGAIVGAAFGTYPIIASAAIGTFTAANYTITYANGTLTVGGITGDYRTVATGNWTSLATWERWNGSSWVTPALDYPGQDNTVQRAYILNGHNITVDANIAYRTNFTRLEFVASTSTANTSLIFAPNVSLSFEGALVSEESNGNVTISVGSGSLSCAQMRLTNSSGTDVSEINVSTGSVSISSTTTGIQLNGTIARSIFRFTDSGTLSINQGITGGGAFIAGTSTVIFGNFDVQNLPAYAFHNVILSGSGIKTFDALTTITRSLTISGTGAVKANLQATYTIPSLVFNTTGQLANSYGAGGSGANIETDDYFDSVGSGIIEVLSNLPSVRPNFNANYTYNGLPRSGTPTNSGTGTSYTYAYTNNGGTLYSSSDAPTNVGNYFVTVTVAANGAWSANSSAQTGFAIVPRPLTITATNQTKQFGGTLFTGVGSVLFSASPLQNNETISTVTISSTGAAPSSIVGTYPIEPSAAVGGSFTASNYTITYVPGILTVESPASGNYRSVNSGEWTNVNTWQRWDGSNWVTPTTYPCQSAAPLRVEILNSHEVTCGIGIIGANRPRRIEILAGVDNTSLRFTSTNYFEVNDGAIILSSAGGGNALLDVGNANIYSFNTLSLRRPEGGNGTCKVIINNGLLNLGTSINMAGTAVQNSIQFDGSGTLRASGGTISGGTIVAGTGTVVYSGVAQAVGSYAFNNLILEGSGIKTVSAGATIAGNLTIDGSASASLAVGQTYAVDTLTLGCNEVVNGPWGSTMSGVTNKNDSFFQQTTGSLNVATDRSLKLPVTSSLQPTCENPAVIVTVAVQYPNQMYSFDNGVSYQLSNVSDPLLAGTYSVRIRNTRECGFSPVQTVNLVTPVKTWTGTAGSNWNNPANWSPSGVPAPSNCISIPDVTTNLVVDGTNNTVSMYALTVGNGGSVTVNSTNSLKVTDAVTVTGTGTVTFESGASLVQVNDAAANSGNILYNRATPSLLETDFTYWSSPVVGQTLTAISPINYPDPGGYFYSFNNSTDQWSSALSGSTVMLPGVGYIMRGQDIAGANIAATFTGVPNNGPQTVQSLSSSNSFLIGNPYPSAIDADLFLAANPNIQGTIYFWTHRTPIANLVYSADDYASYNTTGGVQATSGGAVPSGKIAATQGFFATSAAVGPVTFNNSMRVDGSGIPFNNSNFYKAANKQKANAFEKHRVWLDVTNSQGAFKQMLVGYITNATNEYDSAFDGKSFDGNEFVDFYSINENKNLTIQGRALPFDENDVVPLGFRSKISGDFSINIHKVDGVLTKQDIVIEDKLTNTFVNLKNGSFTFSTAAGTFNDRFVLRFKDKALSTNDLLAQSNKVLVSVKNNQIKVNSLSEIIKKVTVYDLLGRQIYLKEKVGVNELVLSNFTASNQILLVKTTLENGATVTKEVIY